MQQASVLSPATIPVAVTTDTTISSSTQLTLQASTKIIEVTALVGGVYLLYGPGTASVTVFHEYIPAGLTRQYVVPKDVLEINIIDDGAASAVIVIQK